MFFEIPFVSYFDGNLKQILDFVLCFAVKFYILSKEKDYFLLIQGEES